MGRLKYPIKRVFDGQFLLPWLRLGNGLSRTNTAAVEMDPKYLLSPSCPELGTRRLVFLDDIQAFAVLQLLCLETLQAIT